MITVGVKNFRTYTENPDDPDSFFRFTFEEGVNLLKGDSGVGKSTLFHAIFWCLYKKPSTGNTPLFKSTRGSSPTVVFVVVGGITVTRTSPGSMLVVTSPSFPPLEGTEAQLYIYRNFGREEMWKTCNYIQQGTTNPLISGELSDSQRWEVLYALALGGDTGNISIERMKNSLKIRLDDLTREHVSGTGELTATDNFIGQERERINLVKDQISSLGVRVPVPGLVDDLRRAIMLPPLEDGGALEERSSLISTTLEELREEIHTLEQRYTDLRAERNSALRGVEENHSQNIRMQREMEDRIHAMETNAARAKHVRGLLSSLCNSANLEEFLRSLQPPTFADFHGRVCKLVRGIVWFTNTLKTYSLEDISTPVDNIRACLREAETTSYFSTCPCCEQDLKITFDRGGGVTCSRGGGQTTLRAPSYYRSLIECAEKWSREPPAFKDLLIRFRDVDVRADLLSEFASLPTHVPDMASLWGGAPETGELRERLSELKAEGIRGGEQIREIHESYDRKIKGISDSLILKKEARAIKEGEYRLVERALGESRRAGEIWNRLESHGVRRGENLVEKIREIERLETLTEQLRMSSCRIDDLERGRDAMVKGLGEVTRNMTATTRLRERLVEVESDVLTGSITLIEEAANEFLENCFDYPVIVKLGTERESKTTKNKKHTFNIAVLSGKNDGPMITRPLDGFSGGETDRISLSLSMAITSFSQFPLLMLDECISSLSSDLKDKTIRALRQHAKKTQKIVVLVCHDAVDGLFDHVCDLEK
jgi:DNA repair exonuclease SbcCD ATPase subunit